MKKTVPSKSWIESRRQAVGLVAAALLGPVASVARGQSAWAPSRTVKIIVPFPAGGANDVIARVIAQGLQANLGQPVIVENRSGASGVIGSEFAYRAQPDGHTLLLFSLDTLVVALAMKAKFDTFRFEPIGGLLSTYFVLVGRRDLPAASLTELVALAGTRSLTYSSFGVGTSAHVGMVSVANKLGVKNLLHVPYQGAAPAIQALLASQVDIGLMPAAAVVQHLPKLQPYAVTSESRDAETPTVPTLREQRVDFEAGSWSGLVAPPGTSPAITEQLSIALTKTLADPGTRQALTTIPAVVPLSGDVKSFKKLFQEESNRWAEVIRSADITANSN
ncbi:Argininosuccinate lyase [Variovorax sp. PBL-H6]|uniref:Bug family tripartite tricarboxylate transporter substrate binding protein n=1 Tax=Variovorax sp. PBL-H6 TaxID=434009 RepID=UPI0013174D9E|nr:tripartite tricarboxylate transporter substrate binding protein [Variovorax sp. PBL-H6]VTU33393.1 Argininosuccinate lyase [Variovorax sp. PBL-H6]